MHIAVKTESPPAWNWWTFEHVDDVMLEASMGRTGNADCSSLLQMRAKFAPVKQQ